MRLRELPKMPTEYSDMNNVDDSETPNFDLQAFIAEVEARPAIWDTTSRIYSDKQMKKKSWDELVDIFISKADASEELRNDFCRILQRKWKSARDCFNRECQRLKMANQGIVTSRKSPYVFYKNLSFLHKVMIKSRSTHKTKNAESNFNEASTSSNTDTSVNTTDTSPFSNIDGLSPNYAADTLSMSNGQLNSNDIYPVDDDNDDDDDFACRPGIVRRLKRRRVEVDIDDDSALTRMLQPNIQLIEGKSETTESVPKTLEEDSDRLFLLSLLEPLRQVPEKLRMPVRLKMMQVVDSAMKCGRDMAEE